LGADGWRPICPSVDQGAQGQGAARRSCPPLWSMYYVGMLACKLPFPVLYDLPTVLVSLFAAMVASGIALARCWQAW
jgi:NO-binding membrane sensor protein with MHYT domain